MKYLVMCILLFCSITIVFGDYWAVSGLVTLDSVDPVLTIISPGVDARYLVEDPIPVLWSTQESNIPDNCIDISWRPDAGSGWQTIQSGYDDTGSYGWNAPTANTNTATLMIGMMDAFGNLGSAVSDPFAILPPMADFSANTLSGFLPLEVGFTDLSPGSPLAWDWDFNGDGISDSQEQNPVWVYDFPSSYTISLTVDYGSEEFTDTKTNYITASLDPATVLNVPTQYSTIQSAIDAADNGDYIIVADGIYYENLQIVGKQITLASHYFIDGDTLHVDNTIIDGSQYRNRDEGSVIAIRPGANPFLSSHIIGFTLTHGRGRSITQSVGGVQVTKTVGGGVFVEQNHPILTRNKIVENDADDEGGGSYALQGLPNLGGMVGIGRVNHGGNLFRDNQADIGKDIYIDGVTFRDEIKAQNCSFSVFAQEDSTVSKYWATSAASIDFEGGYGEQQAITSDIWVATDGSDSNSGTSSSAPFLTIDHALSMAYGSESMPVTIHLAPGVYSPGFTGERFPLQMLSWVTLAGSGADETFLDAEASVDMPCRVFNVDKVDGCQIRDLSVSGGVVTSTKGVNGGGISILDSQALCDGLVLTNNTAASYGGAIAVRSGAVTLSNSLIFGNSAQRGGGIHGEACVLTVDGCEVRDNTTTGTLRRGGAISLVAANQSRIQDSIIKGNSADTGAGIYLQDTTGFRIAGNKIVNNLQSVASFSNGGGGLYWTNTCSGSVANNLIANNTAYQGGAGYGMSTLDFVNNTIVNNRANSRGGGFYLNACSPVYQNSILWGNTAPSGGNQIWLQTDSSDPDFYYCNVQGTSTAFGRSTGSYTGVYENNLNSNPLFISPSTGAGTAYDALAADFSIPESSPCVNTGDPTTDVSAMPFDLSGYARISGTAIDIGAYEFQFPITFLEPPQHVSISISGNTLTLSWNSVMGASSYRVFACDAPSGDGWTEIPFGNGTLSQNGNRLSWTVTLSEADHRYYHIKAATSQRRINTSNHGKGME